MELVDGIEPPSGTYKDPAKPTQLHQLGGEGPSRTATVIRRQVYSLLSSPLHSLPNYLSTIITRSHFIVKTKVDLFSKDNLYVRKKDNEAF